MTYVLHIPGFLLLAIGQDNGKPMLFGAALLVPAALLVAFIRIRSTVGGLHFRSLRDQLLGGKSNLPLITVPAKCVPRKPLDECGICQGGYEPVDVTVWCRYGCGQSVHSSCFDGTHLRSL